MIHQNHVIYRDIKPANILYNPISGETKLIDFGSAVHVGKLNPELKDPGAVEGTLAYMAPEQTGRMNRPVDSRADLYALGATLYELFTGQLPFKEQDPMSLVYAHLAKIPTAPKQLNKDLASVLSGLILKLLAKNAEERYQSAAGVLADLKKIEDCLNNKQDLATLEFQLGQGDFTVKLAIAQKLYGREQELDVLLKTFERVCCGNKELLLVKGFSGIGKSALIHEVHKPMTKERGYFITGKFDQFQKNVPYSAWSTAFDSLCKQILSEPDNCLQAWSKRITAALGDIGKVITDLIPSLKLIIGEQKPIPELGPQESQNRFNYIMQKFMTAMCSKEHPLVIFIDDWQWADSASLQLLHLILTTDETRHLLIIGAYRDNEVDALHPFAKMIDKLADAQIVSNTLSLNNLQPPDVTVLLQDTLQNADCKSLSDVIYQKTKGNPFFTTQILKSLYEQELIQFNSAAKQWQWNIEQIKELKISDNVVELVLQRINKLPENLKQLMSHAACIGSSFDLETLAIIAEQEKPTLFSLLIQAIDEELINTNDEQLTTFKFTHDRIQQGFYQLIAEQDKQPLHLKIGQLLLKQIPESEQEARIFDIVGHLNCAQTLITEQTHKMIAAKLNLQAAIRAQNNTAREEAFNLCTLSETYLEGCMPSHENTTLKEKLYLYYADAAYLLDHEDVIQKCCTFFEQCKDPMTSVNSIRIKLKYYNKKGNYHKTIEEGLIYLRRLGIYFSEHPPQIFIAFSLLFTLIVVLLKGEKKLKNIPTKDLKTRVVSEFSAEIITAAFMSSPPLFMLLTFWTVRRSYLYGVSSVTPFALASFSIVVAHGLKKLNWAVNLCDNALKIIQSYYPYAKPKLDIVVGCFIRSHTKIGMLKNCEIEKEETLRAMEIGDIEYTGYICSFYQINLFFSQSSIFFIQKEIPFLILQSKRMNHEYYSLISSLYLQAVENLSGKNDAFSMDVMCGTYAQEEVSFERLLKKNNASALGFAWGLKIFLQYLAGHYQGLDKWCVQIESILQVIDGSSPMVYYRYIQILYMTKTNKLDWGKVRKHLSYFKRHSVTAPMNFLHKYELIQAEVARVKGKFDQAEKLYDQAIGHARAYEYASDEGIAAECAAEHYLKQGRTLIAKTYMQEARNAFYRWGALAKVRQLEDKYPEFFSKTVESPAATVSLNTTLKPNRNIIKNNTLTQSGNISDALDFMSIMKASQALSGEVQLGKLMERMLCITLENVGADKGLFIVKDKNILSIEGLAQGDKIKVLQHVDIHAEHCPRDLFAKTIVQYVTRIQEAVVIEDALKHEQFGKEEYIAQCKPKSILCVPVLQQGRLVGILYLENNLTTGAFTKQRVQIVNMLASQAAISLENALLYENLEDKVKERTAKIEKLQEELLKTSRQAGKAEIASHMLHNAGNALNQVNTSSGIIKEQVKALKITELNKALALLESNQSNLGHYLSEDPKGKKIAPYLLNVGKILKEEQEKLLNESQALISGVEFVRDIVNSQQAHAKTVLVKQELNIQNILEDALDREQLMKEAHQIHVQSSLENIKNKLFLGDRELIMQVLSTLITNSKKDLELLQDQEKYLHLDIEDYEKDNQSMLKIHIEDNGQGVPEQDNERMFNYDYTTDKEALGYGLHHAANTAKMMGGELTLAASKKHSSGLAFDFLVPKN